MAINFPNNPNNGDTYSTGGKTWLWDGTSWKLNSTPATGIGYTDLSVTTLADSGGGALSYNNSGLFTYTPPLLTFLNLDDTPSTFTAGKWLKVNAAATAIEWTDAPSGGGTNTTYSLEALLSPGVKLTGSDTTTDSVFFDSAGGISITRTVAPGPDGGGTIKFDTSNVTPTNITVADESTETVCYPLFTTTATGNLAPKTGSNIKFNSSSGQLEAGSFKKTGGASTEFLKADGSIDSNTYLSSVALNDLSNVDATTNLANGKILKYDLGSTTWVVADDNASGGGSSSFTGLSDTPSAHDNDKWLKSNGSSLIWVDAPDNDTNTTYTHSFVADGSGNAKFRLTAGGSGSGNQDLLVTAGTNISFDSISASGFTIKNDIVSIGNLNDVTISGSTTTDHVLTWNGSAWVPQAAQGTSSTPNLNAVLGAGNTSSLAATVGDFTCSNLTVNGTTTTVNSNTVNIGDSMLTLNSDEDGTPSQNAGLEIERGTSTNVKLRWNETTDRWQFTNDGTNYNNIPLSTEYSTSNNYVTGASFNTSDGILTLSRSGLAAVTVDLDDRYLTTDTNTTYALDVPSGTTNITLNGTNPTTTDAIALNAGTNISITRDSGTQMTITNDIVSIGNLNDVTISGSPANGSILEYDGSGWVVGTGASGVPSGTIVMYNGSTAPTGWAICNGQNGTPDLRDRFIVGVGSSYSLGAQAGSADAVVVSHNHGNTGNQSANHTHGPGNSMATNFTGDHWHQLWSGSSNTLSGSGTTGSQSSNHFHTIGGNTTDGSPAKWNANTNNTGGHGHGYRQSNGASQSNMIGLRREGGDSDGASNNTDIFTNGAHSHTIDLTGVTTAGISQNHTHDFNFSVSGNTTNSSSGNHGHNINGNTGNQSANHTHSISSEGVSGSGKNLPPYYALLYIMKQP